MVVKICNVCSYSELNLVYQSKDNFSLTTMNKIVPGRTSVYFCERCGHLQTDELKNLNNYYANEYEINLKHEDDDQLYGIVNGQPVYRAAHQAKILMKKVKFKEGMKVLDYGCAKSQTLKILLEQNNNIDPFMFDVTDKYIPYWKKFPKAAKWSTHKPNPEWNGTMDLILSFYALEHVADLHEAISNIKKLLKPGGIFYFLVPNVYKNVADFIVADHINHFSQNSLNTMLLQNGFIDINVDADSHESAFVVCAKLKQKKSGERVVFANIDDVLIQKSKDAISQMADYWLDVIDRIQIFEKSIKDERFVIYGAGFYGNFIAKVIMKPENIICFIDQNKNLKNTKICNRPVLSPENIPAEAKHVFVGMNPHHAKKNIQQIETWKTRKLNYFFL